MTHGQRAYDAYADAAGPDPTEFDHLTALQRFHWDYVASRVLTGACAWRWKHRVEGAFVSVLVGTAVAFGLRYYGWFAQ